MTTLSVTLTVPASPGDGPIADCSAMAAEGRLITCDAAAAEDIVQVLVSSDNGARFAVLTGFVGSGTFGSSKAWTHARARRVRGSGAVNLAISGDPQSGGGAAATVGARDLFTLLEQGGINILGIPDNVAAQTFVPGFPDNCQGYRSLRIVYGADYAGIPPTFLGIDRHGAAQSETFPVVPGGAVVGTKLFALVTGYAGGGGPGGGASHHLQIQYTQEIGLSRAPILAVAKVTKDGTPQTLLVTDLTRGAVDVGPLAFGSVYEVCYAVEDMR